MGIDIDIDGGSIGEMSCSRASVRKLKVSIVCVGRRCGGIMV